MILPLILLKQKETQSQLPLGFPAFLPRKAVESGRWKMDVEPRIWGKVNFDIFIVQGDVVPRSPATALLRDKWWQWQGDPSFVGSSCIHLRFGYLLGGFSKTRLLSPVLTL